MSKASASPGKSIGVSERLSLETAIVAGRLGEFLTKSLPGAEGSLADGINFLADFFKYVSLERPLDSWSDNPLDRTPAGEPHPIDRLALALNLSAIELQLLLLTGMTDEHEGLA